MCMHKCEEKTVEQEKHNAGYRKSTLNRKWAQKDVSTNAFVLKSLACKRTLKSKWAYIILLARKKNQCSFQGKLTVIGHHLHIF